jgi:hypothetical protein
LTFLCLIIYQQSLSVVKIYREIGQHLSITLDRAIGHSDAGCGQAVDDLSSTNSGYVQVSRIRYDEMR